MKPALLEYLACPDCGGELDHRVDRSEGEEILSGELACPACPSRYPIQAGVPRFVDPATGHRPTASAFAWQWKRYPGLADMYRRQFLDWIAPVQPEDFTGQVVLEGGCGKGRHTDLVAGFGARAVLAVDLSEAVDIAFENTRGHANAHVIQADLNHLPVKRVVDRAFSVGVLHHLPDPETGFRSLASRLRPGGGITAWVYGREGNGWIVHLVSPVRRHLTSRMPRPLLAVVATLLTLPLWALTRGLYGPAYRRGWRLPYGAYLGYIANFPFAEQRTIVFDHLVAPIAHYLRREEFQAWFERAGLERVRIEQHNANSWRGHGVAPGGD